ncbi:uncharacterized protein LOC135387250 [Ornithodoros turicata]|uniref:uncharacterized protein LOC135387250 n=1 Tax=Ornithodoros turicata TaxID=34597 RepID=UPI00313A053C
MLFLTLVCIAVGGYSAAGVSALTTCTSKSDCSSSQECVPHYNFSSTNAGNCNPAYYCSPISGGTCTCLNSGYDCRKKACPSSPYECVVIEHKDTRCGGANGPVCSSSQVCGYASTGVVCITCPCYGTHTAQCATKTTPPGSCTDSVILIQPDGTYTCDGCASATSVLTA